MGRVGGDGVRDVPEGHKDFIGFVKTRIFLSKVGNSVERFWQRGGII